jgi:hypothetical protein
MEHGSLQGPKVAVAHRQSVQRPLLTLFAVGEGLTGLGLILAPRLTSALLLGRQPGLVGPMIARVTGVALAALGIACWGARTDPGSAARSATIEAITAYNAGAGLFLVMFGATGKARGRVVWGAGVLHLCLAAAFASVFTAPTARCPHASREDLP